MIELIKQRMAIDWRMLTEYWYVWALILFVGIMFIIFDKESE